MSWAQRNEPLSAVSEAQGQYKHIITQLHDKKMSMIVSGRDKEHLRTYGRLQACDLVSGLPQLFQNFVQLVL